MKAPLALILFALAACGDDHQAQKPLATTPPASVPAPTPATPTLSTAAMETPPAPAKGQAPITSEIELIKEVVAVLRKVKTLEHAKVAQVTLTKMSQRAQPLIDQHKKLYAGPPAELQAKAEQLKASLIDGMPILHFETDRIQKIPGAREVLEAPLSKIIALLSPQI